MPPRKWHQDTTSTAGQEAPQFTRMTLGQRAAKLAAPSQPPASTPDSEPITIVTYAAQTSPKLTLNNITFSQAPALVEDSNSVPLTPIQSISLPTTDTPTSTPSIPRIRKSETKRERRHVCGPRCTHDHETEKKCKCNRKLHTREANCQHSVWEDAKLHWQMNFLSQRVLAILVDVKPDSFLPPFTIASPSTYDVSEYFLSSLKLLTETIDHVSSVGNMDFHESDMEQCVFPDSVDTIKDYRDMIKINALAVEALVPQLDDLSMMTDVNSQAWEAKRIHIRDIFYTQLTEVMDLLACMSRETQDSMIAENLRQQEAKRTNPALAPFGHGYNPVRHNIWDTPEKPALPAS